MYHVGMSGRGAAGLGKPMTIDELIAEMQRVFDEHEARMVKLFIAQAIIYAAVIGVATGIILAVLG